MPGPRARGHPELAPELARPRQIDFLVYLDLSSGSAGTLKFSFQGLLVLRGRSVGALKFSLQSLLILQILLRATEEASHIVLYVATLPFPSILNMAA